MLRKNYCNSENELIQKGKCPETQKKANVVSVHKISIYIDMQQRICQMEIRKESEKKTDTILMPFL